MPSEWQAASSSSTPLSDRATDNSRSGSPRQSGEFSSTACARGPRIHRSTSRLDLKRTTDKHGKSASSCGTRSRYLCRVDTAHRTMYSGSVRIRQNGGSMLPFQISSRRRRRRTVRRNTRGKVVVQNGRSSQTSRSACAASSGRAAAYCHSVTHASLATRSATSSRNTVRGVQFGPWNSASISVWGTFAI